MFHKSLKYKFMQWEDGIIVWQYVTKSGLGLTHPIDAAKDLWATEMFWHLTPMGQA